MVRKTAWILIGASLFGGVSGCGLTLLRDQAFIERASSRFESGSSLAYERYLRAEIAHDRGEIDRAISWLKSALDADPKDAYLSSRLGTWLLEAGDEEGALHQIERALSQDPEEGHGWLALAEYHRRHGDPARAEEAASRALACTEKPPEAAIWLAGLKRKRGDLRGAVALLEKEVRVAPTNMEARLALAEMALELGDLATSRRHLKVYLASRPQSTELVWELADAYTKAQNSADAADLLELALGRDPSNRELRLRLIELLLQLGQKERARHHLASLELPERGDESGCIETARLLYLAGRPYAARELLSDELSYANGPPRIRLALAAVEIVLGRLEAAELLLTGKELPDNNCRDALLNALRTRSGEIPPCAFSL